MSSPSVIITHIPLIIVILVTVILVILRPIAFT